MVTKDLHGLGVAIRNTPMAAKALSLSQVSSIDLPRTGIIIGIHGRIDLNYDVAASIAEAEDSVARLISEVNIRDGGNNFYYGINDGRLLQHDSSYLGHRTDIWPSTPLGTSVGSARTATVEFMIDFNPDRPSPKSDEIVPVAGIMADRLNELVMEVRLGAASVTYTAGSYTFNSISLTLTPYILATGSQLYNRLVEESQANKLAFGLPIYRAISYTIAGAVAALGYDKDLPTGFLLKKSLLIVTDASNARSNTVVTDVGYENAQLVGARPWVQNWLAYQRALQSAYFGTGNANPTGVALVDWSGIFAENGGLDLRRRPQTWDKLRATTGAAGTIRALHKGVVRQII